MIWFGNLPGFRAAPPLRGRAPVGDRARMRHAMEWVAARAPHLYGDPLLDALEETGWVDRPTAKRLLPEFRGFDMDRAFAERMRHLSFRGLTAADEFRRGMHRIVEDLTGDAQPGGVGPEAGIRFRHQEREGIVLAYPEVGFSIGGSVRTAIDSAVEEMPDALVIVARNFQQGTAEQFAAMLARSEVPGTLVTVNLFLGMRATMLRYQPCVSRVVDLLSTGRPLRSRDIAVLGERS